ncbi:FAD/NAD(P)-binding domain-containing protein [Nemania sp. FL0031]|nr:FAD/NAD(P)-binding domain-containing protein [Nemania sp. FL0031]
MMVRVAIVGAGPAGIITLRYLLAAENALQCEPIEVKLFECDTGVGGTFRARMYEEAELVSSTRFTTFSDFRLGDAPDFLSAIQYLKYLENYCSHFKLWPYMNFSCIVTNLEKQDGCHVLTYVTNGQQETWTCDAVAVCSGLNVNPNIPHIEGIERVSTVIHSSQFKKKEQFGINKTILVLGAGETGADIAALAISSPTKKVVWCHRDGFHLATKTTNLPIDVSRASLFDTMYLSSYLKRSGVLWTYYDCYIRSILWFLWGTTHGWDQWVGEKIHDGSPSESKFQLGRLDRRLLVACVKHTIFLVFFVKSGTKVAPYIGARWRPKQRGLIQRLSSLIVSIPTPIETNGREIDVAPWPECIDEDGSVRFRDNGRPEYNHMRSQVVRPDMAVPCTGYEATFPFLKDAKLGAGNADVRGTWRRDDPTVGFIGFLRPNLGTIPTLAEMQAQLWVLNLLAPERMVSRDLSPKDEAFYKLAPPETARLKHGVDHESYVYQLALDMGSAPSFTDILRIGFSTRGVAGCWWKLPVIWALGANFNTKFRLLGPWKWNGAVEVMTGELWETITRRHVVFGHFTLSVLPILIFGPLSLITLVLEILFRGLLAQYY